MIQRRGSVLLLVLVVVVMLTLASFGLCNLMIEHRRGVSAFGQKLQAEAIAASGVARIASELMQDTETVRRDGGLYNNPGLFRGVVVVDEEAGGRIGRFTVVAPSDAYLSGGSADYGGIRYGLENESARINLNALLALEKVRRGAARRMLSALPEMTEEIADAILDWIDQDDQPRRFGAEANDYSGLQPPYVPRNGPLESIEELLLVRGVTPTLLFGADRNRNGILDPKEAANPSATNGLEVGGWARYLTIYSEERTAQPDGTPKINVNGSDLKGLFTDLETALGSDAATFIVAARQFGTEEPRDSKQSGSAGASGKKKARKAKAVQPVTQSTGSVEIDFDRPAGEKIKSILDLVGVEVRLPPVAEGESERVLTSPFSDRRTAMSDYLSDLMDQLTVSEEATIVGRIHVNLAPPLVLLGIPGMTEPIVDAIVAARDPEVVAERPGRRHATWLLTERIVGLKKMKKLLPFLTATGHVYRAQVVGYFDQGGASARLEVVLSATTRPPRRLLWRDISRLGRGFSIGAL
ncbi:MAG: general secretion pathway protein GspK [Pirellulales bacterium]